MNINSSPNCCENSPKIESPPPIPPKSNLSLNSSFDFGNSLERKKNEQPVLESSNTTENYSEPKSYHQSGNENGEDDETS